MNSDNDEHETVVQTANDEPPKKKLKRKHNDPIKWKVRVEKMEGLPLFPEPDCSRYRDFSLVELFKLFFDENIFEYIVHQSTIYCNYKNWSAVNVTTEEIKSIFRYFDCVWI